MDSLPVHTRASPLCRVAVTAGSIYLTNARILIIVETLFMAWASHGRCIYDLVGILAGGAFIESSKRDGCVESTDRTAGNGLSS